MTMTSVSSIGMIELKTIIMNSKVKHYDLQNVNAIRAIFHGNNG